MTDPLAPAPTPPLDLAALVASRLCHDLISPIGAIGNGVELIALDPRPRTGEIALLADSVASASVKLRFFRLAFGWAAPDQTISRAEVAPILGELYRNGRIHLDWTTPAELPRAEVKLALLMLLCTESALPTGGTVSILRDEVGWRIRAASPRLRPDPALWSVLDGGTAAPDPARVQFPLAAQALRTLDRRADVDFGVAALTVSF